LLEFTKAALKIVPKAGNTGENRPMRVMESRIRILMRLSEYAERIEKTHRKKFLPSTMHDKKYRDSIGRS
jgi:hypothetical protein